MSKSRLFITKPLPQLFSESKESGGLKRSLTALNLTTLGIGAIIGAGIFVLTGQAAAQYAGPGIVLSFIISGLACGFAGLCYAEFASMIPIAGSAYTYSYATLGEFLAWIIGWDLILEYLFAASTVAVGWSGYVVSFLKDLNIFIPPQFTGAVGTVMVNVPEHGMEASYPIHLPRHLLLQEFRLIHWLMLPVLLIFLQCLLWLFYQHFLLSESGNRQISII